MILTLKDGVTRKEIENLLAKLEWMGFRAILQEGEQNKIAIVSGENEKTRLELFIRLPHVEEVSRFRDKFKLVGTQLKTKKTIIEIKGKRIGGEELCIMAGPCSIESEEQIHAIAKEVARDSATVLRGGAFKPRTSPYDFQGLGEEGLGYLRDAATENDLLSVSKVMDTRDVDLIASYVDILQVGARNMQNFSLLKKLGSVSNPILLKRGMSATYQGLLMAAEYIVSSGNPNVILCERGIRTFETLSRNTLDIAAVPILNTLTHLPVIVDPSHETGIRKHVVPMARAGVAAGADGLMIEVHTHPEQAFSDAQQTISCEAFAQLMKEINGIADAIGKRIRGIHAVSSH